jgi:adenylosuccinate synthase
MNPFRHHTKRTRRAYIVQGLAFGDEGKGSMVDYLCRAHDAPLVVRFNGGPQSARHVVQPDGSHHAFHQFGSGMFIPEVCTFLSKHVLIDPFSLMKEAEALERKGIRYTQERLFIDPECLTPTASRSWYGALTATAPLGMALAKPAGTRCCGAPIFR